VICSLWFGVWYLMFWGLGVGVRGSEFGFEDRGSGCGFYGMGFTVLGWGIAFRTALKADEGFFGKEASASSESSDDTNGQP